MAGTPPSSRSLQGLELEYQEFTADVAIVSTNEAAPTTIVTADAITVDGSTVILVEFYAQAGGVDAAASDQLVVNLWLDGAQFGRICGVGNPSATGTGKAPLYGAVRTTPAAGSRTYSVRGWGTAAGTYTVQAGAGGAATTVPGFIRITRVA